MAAFASPALDIFVAKNSTIRLYMQLLLQALIFISSNYLVGLRKSFRRPPLPSMMMLTLRLSAGSCRVSRMKQSTHLAICPAFGQTTSSPCGISLLLPPALMPRPFASVVPPPGTTTRWDPVIVIRSFWKGPDVVESPGSHDVARNLFRTQACDPGAG